MSLTQDQRLRELLGEEVPDSGDDSDTLFSDLQIADLLEQYPDLDRAAYEGWRRKAAKLANLVDTTEGNSQKKFSQLLDNANDMVKLYLRSTTGATEGRSRVGRLRREPIPWD